MATRAKKEPVQAVLPMAEPVSEPIVPSLSGSGRIGVKSSVVMENGKKVANLLLSVTGEFLPDGSLDVDAQNEVTDHAGSRSAAEKWLARGGKIRWDHAKSDESLEIDPQGIDIGHAVAAFDDGNEIFAHAKIDEPVVVRMVERGVPLEASWHGPYIEETVAEKAADGKSLRRAIPIEFDEVSLILPGYPGAARKRSVLIAAKAAQPITSNGGNMNESEITEQINALLEPLTPEQKAGIVATLVPTATITAEPAMGEKAAEKLIDAKLAPVTEAIGKLAESIGESVKAAITEATAKIGEKAASALNADKFDAALADITARATAIGVTVDKIAATPQTVVMPATRAVAEKGSDPFAREFATPEELKQFGAELAAGATTEAERRRIIAETNHRFIEQKLAGVRS